jgi:hypothetical protein
LDKDQILLKLIIQMTKTHNQVSWRWIKWAAAWFNQ